MRSGWYQVAFERDLKQDVTPLSIEKPLVAVKTAQGVRVFDAICPHRGANLGYGGRVEGDCIICPFHGKAIAWEPDHGPGYSVAEYPALTIGGLVFARLGSEADTGLGKALRALDSDHYFVPGFALNIRAPGELVIENGFDAAHFQPVHNTCEHPQLELAEPSDGELRAVGVFMLPPSPWQKSSKDSGPIAVPYTAMGFSPGIILSHMGGQHPYWVLTAATPSAERESTVRLSLAVPAGADGAAPNHAACEYLLSQAKKGIEKDAVIWQHMSFDSPSRYSPEDRTVIAYRKFLNRFALMN